MKRLNLKTILYKTKINRLLDYIIPKNQESLLNEEQNNYVLQQGSSIVNNKAEKFYKLYLKIEHKIIEDELFLDPFININKLSRSVGTNRTYLFKALTYSKYKSLKNLLNKLRLDYASKLIENDSLDIW